MMFACPVERSSDQIYFQSLETLCCAGNDTITAVHLSPYVCVHSCGLTREPTALFPMGMPAAVAHGTLF